MKILVTGGAGYIGSHAVWMLRDEGHEVLVLDDLSTGLARNLPEDVPLHQGDLADRQLLDALLPQVEAIMHFAGSIVVPESVRLPLKYYDNNSGKTRALLQAALDHDVHRFIFSSSASVYGIPDQSTPIDERCPTQPINPYGRSKLMTEWMLRDVAAATPLRYAALRYFNVAGADPQGRTGQSTPDATHLIKIAAQTALGQRDKMMLFGEDYPTEDGTCVRDYIHVVDLVRAHILALAALDQQESLVLNLGYGHGYSVREVIEAVREVSGVAFDVEISGRRPGDPPALVADATRARTTLGWEPAQDDLEEIVASALEWERAEIARASE